MVFRELLQEIVEQTPGSIGATLMAKDGIPVADFLQSDGHKDIQTIAIEYSKVLLDSIRLTSEVLGEELKDFTISSERMRLIFYPLVDGYFITLLLDFDSNFGKGRYLLRKYRQRLVDEL